MRNIILLLLLIALPGLFSIAQENIPDYQNCELSVEERAEDLVSRMTLEEKVAQMSNDAPGIARLGLEEYNYQGEALHGLAEAADGRMMVATSFPQSIAMGSTWNPELMQEVATAISDEARAYYNIGEMGLSFWSPNINMLRDPRWGRNDEAYSEDPYLMSRIAVAYVKGLQGDHPKYLKAIASPKHFVANNSEFNRHDGTSNVSERWLREYYFPAYKACFTEGGAYATMCAYNRVNSVPACGHEWLLKQVLREEWGFEGYVVSDCGAISDMVHQHKYSENQIQAVAQAVKAGMDLECEWGGDEQQLFDKYLIKAVKNGYLEEKYIDRNVTNLMKARIRLGEFDPPENIPYTNISKDVIESAEHRNLALRAARESIILLKNDNNLLPLSKETKSVAVIGPNADNAVLGSYSGKPSRRISVLESLKEKLDGKAEVFYEKGCNITTVDKLAFDVEEDFDIEEEEDEYVVMMYKAFQEAFKEKDEVLMERAVKLASKVDKVILVMGTNEFISTEEADAESLNWPGFQGELIKKVYEANQNVILVLVNGFPITMKWEKENIPAIVEAWYAGQEQGHAIADVLLGDYNPAGRLPVTFYKSEEDLPPIGDYDITKGRTHWFFQGEVLFPFGHGLSYTIFEYSNINLNRNTIGIKDDDKLMFSFVVKNTGQLKGDEVIQLYIKDLESSVVQPVRRLRRFERISLDKGESKRILFTLSNEDFKYWSEKTKSWVIEPGEFEIQIGTSSADIKLKHRIIARN
jgi:beta-glucosidase